ncbi:thioesterase [Sediminibacterium sp.]|uniref:thioesterase n=1 Tax=Sediminibacterium sp. TaxID=1917865 RepID=UPI0025F31381|nr:thioesterase [Sediminibacterium sp.]MBW0178571.1 thioesterase [Sediminibacterium sp.]
MNPSFEVFRKQISNPLKFRLFLLQRLPSAFFSGLKIRSFNQHQSIIGVRYSWFSQNPFRSMYFAVQSMAAEMSTGILGFAQIYQRKPGISMLVLKVEGNFLKKATGFILFTCTDGDKIIAAVEQSIITGEAQTVICHSIGTNEQQEVVAEFSVTWTFKAKQS